MLSGILLLGVEEEGNYLIDDDIILFLLTEKGLMVLNAKVECFFCSKKLTREEIAVLEVSYIPICFKCRKWVSKIAKGKALKLVSALLTLVFLSLITLSIY